MPGGNFVFKMRNVTFAGSGQAGGEAVIMAPQHCGLYNDGMGTLCNVHYDLKDVDFTKVRNNGKWLGFGASGEEYIGLRLRYILNDSLFKVVVQQLHCINQATTAWTDIKQLFRNIMTDFKKSKVFSTV